MKITENIFAAVPLPEDSKVANIIVSGNSIIVETIPEYLLRVYMLSRYLTMEVTILSPAGIYNVTDFVARVNLDVITSKKYWFEKGIEDHDLVPRGCGCDRIISKWIPTGVKTCILDEEGNNTGLQSVEMKEQTKVNDDPWQDSDTDYIYETVQNTIDCPLPGVETRYIETSRECLKVAPNSEENTGYLVIYKTLQERIGDGDWVDIELNVEFKDYDPVECPLTAPPVVVVETQWVTTSTECLKVDGYNNSTQRIYKKEQESTDGGPWIDTGETTFDDIFNPTVCPLPIYRNIYGTWSCVESSGFKTGYKTRTVTKEISLDNGSTWAFNATLTPETSYDTTFCPVLQYGVWTSLDVTLNGTYDWATEQSVEYKPGSQVIFYSVTTVDPKYHFMYLSIPVGKTFMVFDILGNPLTMEDMNVSDIRTNYRDNKLYRYEQPFGTDETLLFKLLIN